MLSSHRYPNTLLGDPEEGRGLVEDPFVFLPCCFAAVRTQTCWTFWLMFFTKKQAQNPAAPLLAISRRMRNALEHKQEGPLLFSIGFPQKIPEYFPAQMRKEQHARRTPTVWG